MIEKININTVEMAVDKALKCNGKTKEALSFLENRKENEKEIFEWIKAGKYCDVKYKHMTIKSRDGKLRYLSMCSFRDRIIMHVILIMIMPKFMGQLSDDAFNCIQYRGINSSYKRGDANHMLKAYMNKGFWGYLQLDIKKCYQSTQSQILEREQRRLLGDQFLDLLNHYSMCETGLPIGTPMSPINHHIIMLAVDRFIKQELKITGYVRYADDMILFGDKQQLHEAYHRIGNKLYYEYGYQLKKESHPTPIMVPLVVLGYKYHVGHTRVKRTSKERMKRAWHNERSRASYLGILKGCDSINLQRTLNMNFSDIISEETKVTRRMDSPLDKIENLTCKFDILDFEVREPDKRNGKYWMRMQVRFEQNDTTVTRLIKGYQPALCMFLLNVEKEIKKKAMLSSMSYDEVRNEFLPIQGAELDNQNGWIFKGTINKIS